MSPDASVFKFIDACTLSSDIVTHCAGLTPGAQPPFLRAPVSGLAPWRAIGRTSFLMVSASRLMRRVACVAGTGSEPGLAGLQPRQLAAARRRDQQRAGLSPGLLDPLGRLRVLARSGGHG
jgi:hypothetical protein